jgi:signal transduction histidine kinase
MHDGVAQVLGYVNTKAQAAQALIETGQTDRAAAHINQLADAARDAYTDVRETILGLRTSLGPNRSFMESVQEYVTQWEEQSGIRADVNAPPQEELFSRLPPVAEVQLLRIVQEAMANVRKHSQADHVSIELGEVNGCVQARVADNGKGFDPSAMERGAFPRFGLATMRERAEAIHGTLSIESVPGQGTSVTVRVPIAESPNAQDRGTPRSIP